MIDVYFDSLGFEEKVKKILKEFCENNSVIIYEGKDFFFLENIKKPSYITKLKPHINPTCLISGLGDSPSKWSKLIVPIKYTQPLIKALYEGLDICNERYLEALDKYITKTFSPEDVTDYLLANKPRLVEEFLTAKKPNNVKGWASTKILNYIPAILSHKTENKKFILLENIIKNNKLIVKDLSFKKELFKFVKTNIDKSYHSNFNKYYEEFQQAVEENQKLFKTPDRIFILEVNKAALYNKLKLSNKENHEKYYEHMFSMLGTVFNNKKIAQQLNVLNMTILQKQQGYKQWRFVFDPLNDATIDEGKIKDFIQIYLSTYNNNFQDKLPSREQVLPLVESILFAEKLNSTLSQKDSSQLKNKI